MVMYVRGQARPRPWAGGSQLANSRQLCVKYLSAGRYVLYSSKYVCETVGEPPRMEEDKGKKKGHA